jgi:hypothetical protein
MAADNKQADVKPPWVVSKSVNPGDDPHWVTPAGRSWLRDVFLPFYDALPEAEQSAYCDRWNAPTPWITLFLHPDLDEAMAEADAEDFGYSAAPVNYRTIFLSDHSN